MKALIVAGGKGTRLRPLTHTKNKALLPIANKPMVFHLVEEILKADITDILFGIREGDEEFKTIINKANRKWRAKIKFIEESPSESKGMLYPIKLAENLIGDESFLFAAGDNILSWGLQKQRFDFESKDSDAHLLVVKREDYQNFGVVVMKGDRVIKNIEKPKEHISNLCNTGIFFFKPCVIKAFDEVRPAKIAHSNREEYYPPLIITWMIENGYKVTASEVTGWWTDTGRPEEMLEANRLTLDQMKNTYNLGKCCPTTTIQGRVQIEKGAVINNSILRGPLIIGKNAKIENSYIGPYTSVGDNCHIKKSEIENSILFGADTIDSHTRRIDSSIFGWNVDINGKKTGSTNSYIIGDNSDINLRL